VSKSCCPDAGSTGAGQLSGRPARRISPVTVIAGLVWLGVAVAATILMAAFSAAPNRAGSPPALWPETSQVTHDPARPTLVMFVHPRCPCSRASIGELAILMAHCQGRVSAHVLFLNPKEEAADWVHSDTWREAAAIPGVAVYADKDGQDAQRFQVETSGDTVLYDANGHLIFHGGITMARGHSGDNPGRSELQALLLGEGSLQPANTPVFGCALFNPQTSGNKTCPRP